MTLGLLLASPWWLLRMLTTERYREGLAQRLGAVPQTLRNYTAGHRVIWLHAVSVGEVLAASRLITELEAALGETYRIVISTTTKTGQHLARERFGAERVFYMPLDFAFATRRYLRALNPSAVILTESELWPRLLHECNTRSIPVAVINARVSDRSFARAMKFRTIWQRILRKPTLFLAQSEQDAQRLTTLLNTTPQLRHPERSAAQSKDLPHLLPDQPVSTFTTTNSAPQILVTGNLKYDIRAPKQNRAAQLITELAQGRPIVVAGSTVASTDPKVETEEAQV
ncbi:MAG: glycosyltransferase N-terminal domain-containing protein, partial [Bryocella sp.]